MSEPLLRRVGCADVRAIRRRPFDAATLEGARAIVDDVRQRGEVALRAHAERLGDLGRGEPLFVPRSTLEAALEALPRGERELLERTATRIATFAAAQRAACAEISVEVPGGRAGHQFVPVERAGCYAPGGRFPLPSSVLMTAVTARVAGVPEVWVASPRPTAVTLAAAAVAGADGLLAAGGAQAIAALAFGAGALPGCDVIVGPGNRWVTAAKQVVAGFVGIDMLAGPSELLVLADDSADAARVAADLLAQAEHDIDAMPVLVTSSPALADAVEGELARQLATLATAATARAALAGGFVVIVDSLDAAAEVCNRVAPEHLQLAVRDAHLVVPRLRHAGALFLGEWAAEVLGDYGAAPNHVLPTGGTARSTAGLSVFTFLRLRTWLELNGGAALDELAADAARLARLEGLEGHARAAEMRLRRV